MLEAEGTDLQRCQLERLEIDREPPSRMILTLSLLILEATVSTRFTLALGLDTLVEFDQWYRWQDYGSLCGLKFYPREGFVIDEKGMTKALNKLLQKGIGVAVVYRTKEQHQAYLCVQQCLQNPLLSLSKENLRTSEGSASKLREHYASKPSSWTKLPDDVHPAVDAFIRKHGLYGVN